MLVSLYAQNDNTFPFGNPLIELTPVFQPLLDGLLGHMARVSSSSAAMRNTNSE
jgi:hypothetical protein